MHKGRLCVVLEMSLFHIGSYHNGYVQVSDKNKGKDYDEFNDVIDTDELTFAGTLEEVDAETWFFGFDSAHYWNERNPESKTFESVKKRTIELCEEMVAKEI